jgi:sialic acid synthase SpsE
VAVAAVALGAVMVEKHFTLDRSGGGPDDSFSMEPEEFTRMVTDIRTIEQALGSVSYDLTEGQKASLCFRRSLFVVKDIAKGERFTEQNVRSIRPGYGLHPRYLDTVIGATAAIDIKRGTPLEESMAIG